MENSINLIDVYKVVSSKKKFVALFVFSSLLIALIAFFVVPKEYKATTVLVPSNSLLADKNRLIGTNIQSLYSYFGNESDQDVVLGFFKLPQLFQFLTEKYNLVKYYKISNKNAAKANSKALNEIKNDLEIIKNEYNQIELSIWLKDSLLAFNICNDAAKYVNQQITNQWKLQGQNELLILKYQQAQIINQLDSINKLKFTQDNNLKKTPNYQSYQDELNAQLTKNTQQTYNTQLTVEATPNALFIIQYANNTTIVERPKLLFLLFSTLIASFIFAVFLVIIMFKKQLANENIK